MIGNSVALLVNFESLSIHRAYDQSRSENIETLVKSNEGGI